MKIGFDVHFFKLLAENIGSSLCLIMRNDNAAYHKPAVSKFVFEAQNVHVVGYAQITANLVFLNVLGADDYDDFRIICKLHKHTQFAVGLKTWQNP